MPGIVGLVTRMPRQRAEAELHQMLGVMSYESFYTVRTWIDESLGLYIGWTARQGSFSDAGPHSNETGDLVLIFSGDEYSGDEVVRDLKARGHRIGEHRSSYLVHLGEDQANFPAGLNGLFHGALIDRRRGRVTIFNDRYSMHRLYRHESKDAAYFAAEAKAILAVRPELRRIDARSLGETIMLGCVLENRTPFEGIEILPGGSLWTFEHGTPRGTAKYFEPKEWEDQPLLDHEGFYAAMRDVYVRKLPLYFAGPERVGMSLTGGLDTRMIMAWQRCDPGTLPCYTWGGTYRDCTDVTVGRKVAQACRQPYNVVTIGKQFLSRFAYYADRAVFLTDGAVDMGLAPDVYMNEQARAIAPARMTGLYGGEVLRRVRSFKPIPPAPGLFPSLSAHLESARETYAEIVRTHPLSFAVFRQAPWHHYGCLSLEQTQISMRTPFLDNDFVKVVFQAPPSACTTDGISLRLIADGDATLGRIPTDRGVDGTGSLREKIAHTYQEFTFKAEYAYDYGMPQWLARFDHALAPLQLERLFLGRHKALHFRVWYRGPLAEYVRDTLLDPRSLSRPYINRTLLEQIVNGHLKGDGNYTTEIHKLLKLELLHRNFIDSSAAASTARTLPATAATA
jgi:asparagine synthase (glutamine-hydrolysing)